MERAVTAPGRRDSLQFHLEKFDNSICINGRSVELQLFLRGGLRRSLRYNLVEELRPHAYKGTAKTRIGGGDWHLTDVWERTERGVRLRREILTGGRSVSAEGANFRFTVRLDSGPWKFFIPGACHDYCPVENDQGYAIVSEERTAFPLVMAYDDGGREAVMLLRLTPARSSAPSVRERGEGEFIQLTEIGGIGFARGRQSPSLIACIPYAEQPSSRMLGKSLQPLIALLPSDPNGQIEVTYILETFPADGFDRACFETYARAHELSRTGMVESERELAECLRARMTCLASLARNWDGHVGLDLNFDPRVGRNSPPSGYGTGFNKLVSSVFPQILEYGFTGRQLNNAFMLALCGRIWGKGDWVQTAEQITRSFLRGCTTPGGFLHTLYDVVRHRAIAPFGDEIGSSLHYGVRNAPPGNYVRNMAEAGVDLCLLSTVLNDSAVVNTAAQLGRFLLRVQNRDGSWYRAYTEGGGAITAPPEWFGGSDRSNKSSTSTVIPFLTQLHELTGDEALLNAAQRAGDWLLRDVVQSGDYRGGTLDNPNIVDKEGMGYAMMALLCLYKATRVRDYLSGAARAGGLALTWNCLWDVPFEEGTRLHTFSFRSSGWGGISILWGTGVVDNYSLWFLPGWMRLAEETGERIYRDVSEMILHGTQQLLSLPGSLYGLCGAGMQEEGFACSHQGVDEGLIRKGDTWGALGWVFAAGTYGVWKAFPQGSLLHGGA